MEVLKRRAKPALAALRNLLEIAPEDQLGASRNLLLKQKEIAQSSNILSRVKIIAQPLAKKQKALLQNLSPRQKWAGNEEVAVLP